MQFPLWAMREYYEITTEGSIKYIYTYRNRYVLDDTSLEGDYTARRMQIKLRGDTLYPLKYKFDTPIQIYLYRKRFNKTKYIDSTGKVFTYVPQTMVEVECKPCKCYISPDNKYYIAVVKGEPYHFNVTEPVAYLALVTWLGTRLVLETFSEKPKLLKYRRKI